MPRSPTPPPPPEVQLLGALCRIAIERSPAPEMAAPGPAAPGPAATGPAPSQPALSGPAPGASAPGQPPSAPSIDPGRLCSLIEDWPFFLRLVAHHRLAPLALKGIALSSCAIPGEVAGALRTRSASNAREAFRYLAELQRILVLLAAANIQACVLKGVPLSLLAYGDVALREVGDIDLLIDPCDAEAADGALLRAGLVRQEPSARLTRRRRHFYARHFKDYTYAPSPSFELDLHWRLVRDARLAASLLPAKTPAPTQTLTLGAMQLPVLSRERTLLYLAVHGALEGWSRARSLADFAALWLAFSPAEREAARAAADTSRLTDFLEAALHLADDWFEFLTPLRVLDGRAAYIVQNARERLLRANFTPEPSAAGTIASKLHQARLAPSFAAHRGLAARIFFRPRMWKTFDLPDRFFFLYPLLSPVEWLYFRLQSVFAKGKHS